MRLFDNIAKVKPKYAQQEALRQRSCLLTLQCAVQCVSFALILSNYCGDASNVETLPEAQRTQGIDSLT